MEVEVDVAVLGAGPAGSVLATLLARRGVSVALVDRDTFPRDKLCGEFLSYDALPILDRMGELTDLLEAGAPPIERCRVVGRHRTYEFPLPSPARGVSRTLLDMTLFRAAVAAGAADWSGWVAAEIDPASRVVTIERDGTRSRITARLLVGAWGRWGRFDTQLRRTFVTDREHRNFGFKRHYRGAAASGVIELYSFARGYLGVSPVEGGVTNVCGLVHASRLEGHKGRWEGFVERIRAEEPPLERMYSALHPAQEAFLSSDPVIFRARSAVEEGVMMIGDAAGVIDPLTGNGMAMAIQSALLAAPHALALLAKERDARQAEQRYRIDHARFFRPRIRWSRQIARLLSRPSLLDAALTIRTPAAGQWFLRSTRASQVALQRLCDEWF